MTGQVFSLFERLGGEGTTYMPPRLFTLFGSSGYLASQFNADAATSDTPALCFVSQSDLLAVNFGDAASWQLLATPSFAMQGLTSTQKSNILATIAAWPARPFPGQLVNAMVASW